MTVHAQLFSFKHEPFRRHAIVSRAMQLTMQTLPPPPPRHAGFARMMRPSALTMRVSRASAESSTCTWAPACVAAEAVACWRPNKSGERHQRVLEQCARSSCMRPPPSRRVHAHTSHAAACGASTC
eukprot:365542-Chlamydomonas_euryale.AAC.13